MKILIAIAYLSYTGQAHIETKVRPDWITCTTEAKEWNAKKKVGSGFAWCKRVVVQS